MDPLLASLLNIGGVGIIAAALVWKVIPSMLDTFKGEQAAQRVFCGQQLDAERVVHKESVAKIEAALTKIAEANTRPFSHGGPY